MSGVMPAEREAPAPPRGALASHLSSRQVSRVIYGAVVGLALVVALEAHPPAPAAVAALLVSTAVAVSLAEFYSDLIGTQIRLRRSVEAPHRREILVDVLAVAIGCGFPAVFFLLAATDLIESPTAFDLAKWSGLALIGFYGFWAARLTGKSHGHSLLHAVAVGAIGALIIAIKALVH